jgi:hypothetical protein
LGATFDRELRRLFSEAGCLLVRQGRHPIWYSPVSDRNFPVPVNIVSRHTANAVLKQAGLEKRF